MTFTDADAQLMLQIIDERIERRLRDGARFHWGVVTSVTESTGLCSVALFGDTANPSPGFRFPPYRVPITNDLVLVRVAPGDRVIEDIFPTPGFDRQNKIHGYLREIRTSTGQGANVAQVSGDTFERIRDILGTTATSIQMHDGTGTPVDVIARRHSDGAVLVKGFGRLRFEPLTTHIQVANGSTTTSATDVAVTSAELTTLPSGIVKAIYGHIIVSSTTGDVAAYAYASNWGAGSQHAGTVYGAVASRNFGAPFVVSVGGTNNRQMQYTVRAGSGTLTYYVRVGGYFTDDN